MYNAEQKENFIREYSTSIPGRSSAVKFFRLTEPYEREYDLDICCWDLERLQPVMDRICGLRQTSVVSQRSMLRSYVKWCGESGVSGVTDAAFALPNPGLEKVRRQTLKNPRHLQAFLNAICDPESDETSDNNFRSYYWLAYAGMDSEEILRVRRDEVDFDRMLVRHGGSEYPLYREALPALRNAATLTAYLYRHPNYGADKIAYRDRVPGDLLMRGIKAVPSIAVMRVGLSRRNRRALDEGKTDLDLSYYRIWLSGVFYRMLEDELAGMPVDFVDFVNDRLGDFQYQLKPGGNTQEYKRRKLAESYCADYERWKQTLL